MNYSPEYYRYLVLLLKGATLVNSPKEPYIDCYKRIFPINQEMFTDLLISGMIELEGGNTDFNETFYIRTEEWRENLEKLKIEYPQFFRKQKIYKLLKNEK